MRLFMFILVLCICNKNTLFAQDTLPKISVNNISNNVIISWTNPFTLLTTINIQRSFDSTKNFTTIGSILDVKNKRNGFVDTKPLSTRMFYRVFMSFEGGRYIFSRSYRPFKDTSRVMPSIKDLQQSAVFTWFVPSSRVYAGKDNNVIISLPDAEKKKYTLKFFEESGTPVFEINKISEPVLTLEKTNFYHAGLFNFELYEEGRLIEKYKVYIPKDGRFTHSGQEQGRSNR
jgi:hypothetical protein